MKKIFSIILFSISLVSMAFTLYTFVDYSLWYFGEAKNAIENIPSLLALLVAHFSVLFSMFMSCSVGGVAALVSLKLTTFKSIQLISKILYVLFCVMFIILVVLLLI